MECFRDYEPNLFPGGFVPILSCDMASDPIFLLDNFLSTVITLSYIWIPISQVGDRLRLTPFSYFRFHRVVSGLIFSGTTTLSSPIPVLCFSLE
jgi:hypothetical protein